MTVNWKLEFQKERRRLAQLWDAYEQLEMLWRS